MEQPISLLFCWKPELNYWNILENSNKKSLVPEGATGGIKAAPSMSWWQKHRKQAI